MFADRMSATLLLFKQIDRIAGELDAVGPRLVRLDPKQRCRCEADRDALPLLLRGLRGGQWLPPRCRARSDFVRAAATPDRIAGYASARSRSARSPDRCATAG